MSHADLYARPNREGFQALFEQVLPPRTKPSPAAWRFCAGLPSRNASGISATEDCRQYSPGRSVLRRTALAPSAIPPLLRAATSSQSTSSGTLRLGSPMPPTWGCISLCESNYLKERQLARLRPPSVATSASCQFGGAFILTKALTAAHGLDAPIPGYWAPQCIRHRSRP